MAIQGFGILIARDFHLFNIVIPVIGSVAGFEARAGVTAVDNEPPESIFEKIAAWEIVDNDRAIVLAKKQNMSGPTLTFAKDEGIPPTVGRHALLTTFIRSASPVAANAILICYVMDEKVLPHA